MLILSNNYFLLYFFKKYNTKIATYRNHFKLKKNINIPSIILFQNKKYSINFFFFNIKSKLGSIKHATIGIFNKIFFPHSSKKKNIKALIKLLYFFLKDTINYTADKISLLFNNVVTDAYKIINKLYFNETFKLSMIFNNKKLLRLNKKKRSLQRKARKKIFTSKFGRI